MPRVSVLVRTYNRAALIAETMESVLAQTFPDFEIVVVDDGSTDDTESVIRQFPDPRIRYLFQQNQGQSGALNTGVLTAQGEYLAVLDSDDVWQPQLLATAVATLDANPDAGLFYAQSATMGPHGEPSTQLLGAPLRYPGLAFKSLLYGDPVAPGTVVVRRGVFEKAGLFDPAVNGTEDWDMWVRIARYYGVAYVPKVLARYRYHQSNFTGIPANVGHLIQARVKVLDKVFESADLPPEARDVKALAYRNVYMDVALRWLSAGAWSESLRYFGKAIRVAPSPLTTPLRIAYLILFYRVISKTSFGSRAVAAVVAGRRKPGGA